MHPIGGLGDKVGFVFLVQSQNTVEALKYSTCIKSNSLCHACLVEWALWCWPKGSQLLGMKWIMLGTGCKKAVSLSKVRTNTIWFQMCSKHNYTNIHTSCGRPTLKDIELFRTGLLPWKFTTDQFILYTYMPGCMQLCSVLFNNSFFGCKGTPQSEKRSYLSRTFQGSK